MRWSDEQRAFFAACADPDGEHLVLRARAGTGKTTTIVSALGHFDPALEIAAFAFNKKNALELQKRITAPNASASTLHSAGFKAMRSFLGAKTPQLCKGSERERGLAEYVCGDGVADEIVALVGRLASKARDLTPLAESIYEILPLAEQFDLLPDPDGAVTVTWVAERVLECLIAGAAEYPTIDFVDMIFLPIRNRWLRPLYDVVIVDECQDMSAAQLLIARGVCRPGGRIIVVGDDRQAIYGFRGAASDSIDRLKADLNATEYPLTTTYRCAQAIVREAQRLVPDIQAHPSNPEGEVLRETVDKALGDTAPGDFVLSRTNAALVTAAMKLIRAGKPTKIEGRDVGAGLISLVRKLCGRVNSIPNFLSKLRSWGEREGVRIRKAHKDPDTALAGVADKVETLCVLADGATGVAELIARCESLFADHDDNGKPREFITCSTVHKAKGLEADRVVILVDTFTRKGKSQDPQEAANIEYVAITRAKRTLVFASDA